MRDLLSNVGSGGGAPAAVAASGGGAAAAATEAPKEEEKEEKKEDESDDDMVRMFFYLEWVRLSVVRGAGFRSLRLRCLLYSTIFASASLPLPLYRSFSSSILIQTNWKTYHGVVRILLFCPWKPVQKA